MESELHKRRLSYLLPGIIVIIATALRIAYFTEIVHDPAFSHPIYDPEYNAHWARGIATGDWTPPPGVNDPEITSTPHGRPPGYPWFLSVIYILFGVNDYAPRVVQMALGIVNALLLYLLGKRLFGNAVGFTAGLLMATYWALPYFEGLLTYPVLAVFLLLCLLLTLERWLTAPLLRRAALAGALLGCFALLRPNVLLFAPVLACWMFCLSLKKHSDYRKSILTLATLTIACMAVLSPAFVRNYVVAKDVVFISSYGGINLYVGNHPEASLVEPKIPELMELAGIENWTCFDYPAIVCGIAAKKGKSEITFSEANHYFYQKAFQFIKEKPGMFLKNMLTKAMLFWGPHEITNDTVMEYDKRFSGVLRLLPGFSWFAALFVFGSAVTISRIRDHKENAASHTAALNILLWLYVGTYFLSVIIYFVAGRYRVPIIPVMLLFSAVGVVWLFEALRAKSVGRTASGFSIIVILFLLFRLNPTGYVPDQSTWHLRKAMAYTASGEDDKAETEYWNALKLGANASVAYANLGRLYITRGEKEEGIDLYKKGLLHNPHNATIHNNLGYELYHLGNLEESVLHFKQATESNPRFALAHVNLGNVLFDLGHLDEALHHFQQAATITPGDATLFYNMARVYFAKENYDDAIVHYEKALVLKPQFTEALNNLGYLYANQGNYETAIPYYEKAIASDPRFLLAYNNLGNVRFEQGDIDAAAAVYEQALKQKADDVHTLYNLGRTAMAQENWKEAISFLTKALEVKPDYDPALRLLEEARQKPESDHQHAQ
jgi:tetratricopeptide (TPR) repeat protein